MKTRSLLVRLPSVLLTVDQLIPDRCAALTAACLTRAGHTTFILDTITPSWLSDIAGGDSKLSTRPGLATRVARRFGRGAGDSIYDRLAIGVVDAIRGHAGLHFVAFHIECREQLGVTAHVVRALRSAIPDLQVILFGRAAVLYGDVLMRECAEVDTICLGDPERTVVRWADALGSRCAAMSVPDLMLRVHGKVVETGVGDCSELDALPAPAYDLKRYPAVASSEKLNVFSVEETRGASTSGHGSPWRRVNRHPFRRRSACSVVREICCVRESHPKALFLLDSVGVEGEHCNAVAQGLLAQHATVVYGRELMVECVEGLELSTLRASGCEAISWLLDTGSQRLLDRYYGRDFTVSQAVSMLRACAMSDIHTNAVVTHPCGDDDYHTRDETLRLLKRAHAQSVCVRPLDVAPGSFWASFPDEFNLTRALRDSERRTAAHLRRLRDSKGCEAPSDILAAELAEEGWERPLCLCDALCMGIVCREELVDYAPLGAALEPVHWEELSERVAAVNKAIAACDTFHWNAMLRVVGIAVGN